MILSVTGHRPDRLGGYGLSYERLTAFARSQIEAQTPEKVITGGAQGFDFACAFASFQLKIPYDVIVPFIGYNESWPAKARRQLEWIEDHARQVVMIATILELGEAPTEFYRRRDYRLVDDGDRLLALWNGDEQTGTAMTVRYARRKGKQIVNCWRAFVNWK